MLRIFQLSLKLALPERVRAIFDDNKINVSIKQSLLDENLTIRRIVAHFSRLQSTTEITTTKRNGWQKIMNKFGIESYHFLVGNRWPSAVCLVGNRRGNGRTSAVSFLGVDSDRSSATFHLLFIVLNVYEWIWQFTESPSNNNIYRKLRELFTLIYDYKSKRITTTNGWHKTCFNT